MKRLELVVNGINSNHWAILPEKMDLYLAIIRNKVMSIEIENETIEAKQRATPYRNVAGNIAQIQIFGTLAQRFGALESGGTTTEQIGGWFDQAMADPNIGAIVLQIDSPGGSVHGMTELASKIYNARGTKPIVAVCDSLMASAAYWIGSAADQIVVTPSGEIGSIGVLAVHVDDSEADAKAGVKTTVFRSTEHKAEGIGPLSEDSSGYMQSRVMDYHNMFVSDIARNRKTSVAKVNDDYGKGRVFGSEQAVKVGMADRVATLATVIGEMQAKDNQRKRNRAELDLIKLR
jgi:signal peptide peptidase SppA